MFAKSMASSACTALLLASAVAAHGTIGYVTIAGKRYDGVTPSQDPTSFSKNTNSIVRQIFSGGPIQDVNSADMTCGPTSQFGTLTANVNPGDDVEIMYYGETGPSSKWPHNVGPLMAYMTACPSSNCNEYNATDAEWFKIMEQGQNAGGPGTSAWVQGQTIYESSKPYSYKIPSDIAPGSYLIRNEVLALQNGGSPGGAEFYPACVQVTVGGSGSGKPASGETVKFPGAYSATNPGVLVTTLYNPGFKYSFPGPDVASFVIGSGSGSGNNSTSPSSASSSAIASSTPASASSTAVEGAPTSATPASSSAATTPSSVSSSTKPAGTGTCNSKRKRSGGSGSAAVNSSYLVENTGKKLLDRHQRRRLSRAARYPSH